MVHAKEGTAQDLGRLMMSMGGKEAMSKSKGSRFTHIEKLQFAQVSYTQFTVQHLI